MSLHIGDTAPDFTVDTGARDMFPQGFETIKPYLRLVEVA